MIDPLSADITACVSTFIADGLAENGDLETLNRFRTEGWALHRINDLYVAEWADGTPFASIPSESVAWAVGTLRAMRGAPDRRN